MSKIETLRLMLRTLKYYKQAQGFESIPPKIITGMEPSEFTFKKWQISHELKKSLDPVIQKEYKDLIQEYNSDNPAFPD